MFDKFDEHATRVMHLARNQVYRYDHDCLGTEHILLGLVEEAYEQDPLGGSGLGAEVLKSFLGGRDLAVYRDALEERMEKGPSRVTMGQLPFTPLAREALVETWNFAARLGHGHIGQEHLSYGLLMSPGETVQAVFSEHGVSTGDYESRLLRALELR